MWSFLLQMVSAILGIWLAQRYLDNVFFIGHFFVFPSNQEAFSRFLDSLVFVGAVLGFLNSFVKPILNKIALPLRFLTLNLFSLVIAMFLVWLVDIFFPTLIIKGLKALFLTTAIILLLNIVLSTFFSSARRKGPVEKD